MVPTVLLFFVQPVGRLIFFMRGLIFAVAVESLINLGGPDSPALLIPALGLIVSLAAVITEAIVRVVALLRKQRAKRSAGIDAR